MVASFDIAIGVGIFILIIGWKKGYFWLTLFTELIITLFIFLGASLA